MKTKSNREELRKRGFIENDDIDKCIDLKYDELIKRVNSKVAEERTVAIHILFNKFGLEHETFIQAILEQLCDEKCLYTKLKICEVLQTGDIFVVEKMIPFLGKIGNNQHRKLPEKISEKISYPLPRDIIARTLGKMDIVILQVLLKVFESNDKYSIYEVLDAVGFLVFYNNEVANSTLFNKIILLLERYNDDELMLWKVIICLSAFPLMECKEFLLSLLQSNNSIIKEEVERSLKLISMKI